jgi:pimeloyl-ACP methyl ester carboxylesterase
MDAIGLPGRPIPGAALWLAERLSGARFDEVRPVDLLWKVRCPVLVIAPASDVFRTPAETAAMERALAERPASWGIGRVWHVEGVDHLMSAHADPAEYRQVLASFLAEALDGSQPPPAVPPAKPGLVQDAR